MRSDMTATRSPDRIRQSVVAVSAVLALLGSFIGSGAAGGTQIQDAAGGALTASSTPVAPDGPAFAIWSVIYSGLIAYAIWQFLPSQTARTRHRRLGYWAAASLLLNAAWILVVQAGFLTLSVIVIALLLAVLARIFVILRTTRSAGLVDAILTDGTFGLYLGWVCVATAANVAAGLVGAGVGSADGPGAAVWAVVVLAVAALIGLLIAVTGRGRLAPMLSLVWGLSWVAVGRFAGELVSVPAGVAALVAAVVVLAATLLVRVTAGRQVSTGSRT
ncbi:tryptophan-rich sensory protein [Rathayibacter rathayi]|uniref:Tryptophan-rich sensory protein n=2 Tax=Rathayibacter rathayi TaxID=33887 RepID=A0ABD6W7D3_RATRA|nr:tryptophan-rich sensory protein [Rathayibacter rathayi]MWV73587.1 tryptophan-rich sensory protein [Rathayibacter rathayi NCPPB 2980 = VKM Ac-1601]PPF11718.1 tryptophan-rich sensory protein [Rathayibacter rathayi]PPF22896.1 tryptophan-rich sensory protein [Rathayibacter rathayi]PPF47804.1 tryptophan-rich sensory protein [Rathayibacter rathayi]